MSKPIYNDQAYIAEKFLSIDELTIQTARLAFFRINSYKLSLIKSSFSTSREELTDSIQKSLLNYTNPGRVLADLGFFEDQVDN
jgi:hypothetical protein